MIISIMMLELLVQSYGFRQIISSPVQLSVCLVRHIIRNKKQNSINKIYNQYRITNKNIRNYEENTSIYGSGPYAWQFCSG